jgi:hypothetical protein
VVSNPSHINPVHIPPFYFSTFFQYYSFVYTYLVRLTNSFFPSHWHTKTVHACYIANTPHPPSSDKLNKAQSTCTTDYKNATSWPRTLHARINGTSAIVSSDNIPTDSSVYITVLQGWWHKSETSLACYKLPVKHDAAMPTETLVPLCYFVPNTEKLQ